MRLDPQRTADRKRWASLTSPRKGIHTPKLTSQMSLRKREGAPPQHTGLQKRGEWFNFPVMGGGGKNSFVSSAVLIHVYWNKTEVHPEYRMYGLDPTPARGKILFILLIKHFAGKGGLPWQIKSLMLHKHWLLINSVISDKISHHLSRH